jgi:hypothetical protein
MTDIVTVFTSKSLEKMFSEGGTGYWKADPTRIGRCQYVICVRNANTGESEDQINHGCAFLIGRNIKAVPDPESDRYVIAFEEYAEIKIENFWQGQRNPVSYMSPEELKSLKRKLDLTSISFKPFPTEKIINNDDARVKPLTILEAKRGIAKSLGISPDAIEITIRA